MLEFKVLIIDYLPNEESFELIRDMKSMKHKAKTLKNNLVNGPLVIFDDQVIIEPDLRREFVVVEIQNIPDNYLKKVHKLCKKIEPYSIRTTWKEKKE